MGRTDRLKELGIHAQPDHRLLPKHVLEQIEKLPRNERRLRKKVIDRALGSAYKRMIADNSSGAGYPIDMQIREFLMEYNDRQLGHGLLTLPSTFNVMEGFLEFCAEPPVHFFALRPEKDHLFSLSDFFDFATSGNRREDGLRTLAGLPDGLILNFTPIGDVRDLAFLHADSHRFVIAGFTLVRRDDQLHWAMVGGPIVDLDEETHKLRETGTGAVRGRPPEKAHIDVNPDLEYRAESLKGTDDVWKTVVYGRFNLRTESHEVRGIARDYGNQYYIIADDPDMFDAPDPSKMSARDRETAESMIARLEADHLLIELAETCFLLPSYFDFRITLIRESIRATAIGEMSALERNRISGLADSIRPYIRKVAALEIVDLGQAPVLRSYNPPSFRVEVEGFWRRLTPDTPGHDQQGNPVRGRTWVKGHLRWRDRPSNPHVIYLKSSISSARAKAAAVLASYASAAIVGDEVHLPQEIVPSEPMIGTRGWLYVMRCPLMDDDVYKIGWSSRHPKDRAAELSNATGVPMAYIVVDCWKLDDAREAEVKVHLALSSFRINPRREFFRAPFSAIRSSIVNTIGARDTVSE
ncbi:GIY-YIG nuclease family protein [Mesorhizobium australicum]|uniref:GIY-YIG nuclease family protein n=1 Tax=Mesorhizobium australicum TaxID=536018 RepID=UPI00333B92C2